MDAANVDRLLIPSDALVGPSMVVGKGQSAIPVNGWRVSYDYGILTIYAGDDTVEMSVDFISGVRHYRNKKAIVIRNNNPLFDITLYYEKFKVVVAEWSGSWPCLCSGWWRLTVNGIDCTHKIPYQKRNKPMDTYGTYSRWFFGDHWDEQWEEYKDGLKADEWIEENKAWLKKLPLQEDQYKEVYDAFREHDFRLGSCGGCI